MKITANSTIKYFVLRLLSILNDDIYIKIEYLIKMKKKCRLKNPTSLTEKIQWLKINFRNELVTSSADKYKVRELVCNRIGNQYLNDLIWYGNSPEEIPFEKLPDKYVIKVNHGAGFNILVDDKNKINEKKIIKKLHKWLKMDYSLIGRQWAYSSIERKIIIEKYLVNSSASSKSLLDYKLYIINGNFQFIQLIKNRDIRQEQEFYNIDWEPLKIKKNYNIPDQVSEMPVDFLEMVKISESLSKGLKFCRVDLYYIDQKIIFGEITHYPLAGYIPFTEQVDKYLGSLLRLEKTGRNNENM